MSARGFRNDGPGGGGRRRRGLLAALLVLAGSLTAAIVVLPTPVRAATLYVGGIGPGNHTTIGNAMAAASPGDTVFVYGGTYRETVSMRSFVSLVGENRDTTIIDGAGGWAVYMATGANVSQFTLTNALIGVFVNERGGPDCACRIADNRITGSTVGIYLNASMNVSISNNEMVGSGISFESGYNNQIRYWNTHTIQTSNIVNGKPVYYWKDVAGGTVPPGAGQVILANVTDVTVEGQSIGPTSAAIELGFSTRVRIAANAILFADPGFFLPYGGAVGLYYSDANTITGNAISDSRNGLYLWSSHDNTIDGNTILNSQANGVELAASQGVKVTGNTISWNRASGVVVDWPAGGNLIANNTMASNLRGVFLGSDGNTVVNNTLSTNQNGIQSSGGSRNTIARNTVTGSGDRGIEVSGGAFNVVAGNNVTGSRGPGIQLYQTRNNTVLSNTATNNRDGIFLGSGTFDNLVLNNTAADNSYGITLFMSTRDTVERNNVSRNRYAGLTVGLSDLATATDNLVSGNAFDPSGLYGVYLDRSVSILVYHNNIERNTRQAFDNTGNRWDNGYPSGGNHWSDYSGIDDCSGPLQNVCPSPDGIGDTPYGFSTAQDRYPLMASSQPTPTPPSEPWNLRAVAGDTTVTLTWSAPLYDGGSLIANYRIFRGTSSGGEAFLVELGNVLTYTDTGRTNGQAYYYQVSARNAVGEGPRSSEASATPLGRPGAPQLVIATASGRQVLLFWNPPSSDGGSAVTAYRIYRGTASGGETYLDTVGAVQSYLDAAVLSGIRYFYRVSAVNVVGEGPKSAEADATVPNDPPTVAIAAPGPGATLSGMYPVAGTSEDPDGAVQRIEVSIDNGSWIPAIGTDPWRYDWNTTTVFDGAHTIRARAYDGTDYSSEANVTVTVRNGFLPPPPPTGRPVWEQPLFWAGIATILIVAGLVGAFLLLRRRKRRKPEPR